MILQAMNSQVFMPFKSSTLSVIGCTSDKSCPETISNTDITCSAGMQPGICVYHNYTYADHSSSAGYLFEDSIAVVGAAAPASTADGTTVPAWHNRLVFGCGIVDTGVEATYNASGLMGLSRGPLSLVSQLGLKVFSYCFPNRAHTTNVTGYLALGSSITSSQTKASNSLQYTPMLQNLMSPSQSYFVELIGISIDGTLLSIPPSTFALSSDGLSGGAVVDSGTTFTEFVDEAFTVFQSAFVEAMDSSNSGLARADQSDNVVCYVVPPSHKKTLIVAPKVTLHLGGMVDIHLTTDHSLYDNRTLNSIINNDPTVIDYFCMAYRSGGSLLDRGRSIIGNYQQQDLIVEFDMANSRIGFAPSACDNEAP
ncbi:hypothetical protein L7F22_021440 [Adiantum nelumboides]|nr:hypothetical protein [Adiantum nelumboides]